eukprot:5521252-Pyramimonas_sp.AAC.1
MQVWAGRAFRTWHSGRAGARKLADSRQGVAGERAGAPPRHGAAREAHGRDSCWRTSGAAPVWEHRSAAPFQGLGLSGSTGRSS